MVKKWITWINYGALGIIALLLSGAGWLTITRPDHFVLENQTVRKSHMPKRVFERPQEEYDAIGPPALSLKFSPLTIQLPDLRRQLVYYGKNGRPDAKTDQPMHFSFVGNKTPVSVLPGEPLYFTYDRSQQPPQYVFTPGNAPSPLWIVTKPFGNQAAISVYMKDDNGHIVREPTAYAEFPLTEKEYVRSGAPTWEIGKFRVDGTLLARQKAKWYGIDRFLERHGGKEYEEFQNKQRIDFGEGEDLYSIYVGIDDCMIWKNERWNTIKPGEASLGYPLICLKKLDDRIINLELWDVDGKSKIILNLLKVHENWLPQNIRQNFKFLGARTRSQFVFEIDNERMLLKPQDWLLLTDKGWIKLSTPEEIDQYVDRKLIGPLFVFDGIEKKEDRQIIVGTLFNAARTEMAPIEIPLQPGGTSSQGQAQPSTMPEEAGQKTRENKS